MQAESPRCQSQPPRASPRIDDERPAPDRHGTPHGTRAHVGSNARPRRTDSRRLHLRVPIGDPPPIPAAVIVGADVVPATAG